MAQGKAGSTIWFQKDKREPSDAQHRGHLERQLARIAPDRIRQLNDAAKGPKGQLDGRLKSQSQSKRNLLKAGVDYFNGKRAYFPRGRSGEVPPNSEIEFLATVMRAVTDIDAMFERAGVVESA